MMDFRSQDKLEQFEGASTTTQEGSNPEFKADCDDCGPEPDVTDRILVSRESLLQTNERREKITQERIHQLTRRIEELEDERGRETSPSKRITFGPIELGEKFQLKTENERSGDYLRSPEKVTKIQEETSKLKVRAAQYDGSTSWEDYIVQFDLVSELNAWDCVTKAAFLAVSLLRWTRSICVGRPTK
ncbi:hypothetical protein QZH41_000922 [Actinostola sp. cb2023]|nr:hypothetical protein QZH41_000922 [Actinostola sp. cb2023]